MIVNPSLCKNQDENVTWIMHKEGGKKMCVCFERESVLLFLCFDGLESHNRVKGDSIKRALNRRDSYEAGQKNVLTILQLSRLISSWVASCRFFSGSSVCSFSYFLDFLAAPIKGAKRPENGPGAIFAGCQKPHQSLTVCQQMLMMVKLLYYSSQATSQWHGNDDSSTKKSEQQTLFVNVFTAQK